jgi:transcriptional regulator with XRE-family HTH domain
MKEWEKKVVDSPGAADRLAEIEEELRLAAGLTALREEAGLSQRELAKRIGVSQPRVAAIERSRNVTLDVLEDYVGAVGGRLEVSVVKGSQTIPLIGPRRSRSGRPHSAAPQAGKRPPSPCDGSNSPSAGAHRSGRSVRQCRPDLPKIVRLPAGASVARSKDSGRSYCPEWGRSLKIRMPRYLFIHACLCG